MQQPPPPPSPSEQPGSPQPFTAYPPYEGQQMAQQPGYPSPYGGQQPEYAPPYPGQQPGYPAYAGQSASPYPDPLLQQQGAGNIARKNGLIFGAILVAAYVVEILADRLLAQMVQGMSFSLTMFSIYSVILSAAFVVIYWVIYFLAGFLTARSTQQVKSAGRSGLWITLCYIIAYVLVLGYNLVTTLPMLTAGDRSGIARGLYLNSVMSGIAITLILRMGGGIGVSLLGGLLGQSSARKQTLPPPFTY